MKGYFNIMKSYGFYHHRVSGNSPERITGNIQATVRLTREIEKHDPLPTMNTSQQKNQTSFPMT